MSETPASLLERLWNQGEPRIEAEIADAIPLELRQAINRSINSQTKTYRYVLPTQLLAKLSDLNRDAHAIQNLADMPGSFDARSFCHSLIVPFDRENHSVLGGSGEPYVNNPLRVAAITQAQLKAQRNKPGFQDLILVCSITHNRTLIRSRSFCDWF